MEIKEKWSSEYVTNHFFAPHIGIGINAEGQIKLCDQLNQKI